MTCLIFDCDGTLVDSEGLANTALSLTLAERGVSESAHDLFTRYHGMRKQTSFDDLEARHGVRLTEAFDVAYRTREAALMEAELQAIPGVLDALAQLDLPRCVASSGPRDKIARSLRVTGLARFFGDRVYSAYDIGSWKPDPGLFLHAAQQMDASPADCIVIEDSAPGVQAALRAGMRALWYVGPGLSVPAALPAGVVLCRDMRELPQQIHALR